MLLKPFRSTLTAKGYEVLGTGNYGKYLRTQAAKSWAIWLPILISAIALYVSFSDYNRYEKKITVLEYRVGQLYSSLNKVLDPFHRGQTRLTNILSHPKENQKDTAIQQVK